MVVNNLKKIVLILIIFLLSSCKKEKVILDGSKMTQTLEQKIYDKADLFIDSANCRNNKVIAIRYQQYNKKEFIQISAQDVFITDSLFMLRENKGHVIAIYNKEFFEKVLKYNNENNKKIVEEKSYLDLYKANHTATRIPCFYMYELINGKLVQIPKNSYYYNNLFSNPPMFEITPPLTPARVYRGADK
ncbi:hypothetical protein D1631_08960 [Chryseobacterium nematophagum]|uniref:Uncharacterized protein n=1 Tax=Chryseobacterium nematophagum TaxID=2305228 RepID=A0A3M7TEV9_9FLAO|nr:hypothetical protein [Chryseobacterium nematophagum]RNA62055.1 hypothetical protein D1631_08960 [Chryseobacterium nematophagum]